MGKEKVIRVRIDESEEKVLSDLEKKYNVTKSQILREGIANYESLHKEMLYPLRIQQVVESLGKNYAVDSCGIIGDDILLGKGIWLDLHADYFIPKRKCIQYGECHLIMKDNEIHIEGGYLEEIRKCLMILQAERRKGGVGMSYFKIEDENKNINSYVLFSYELNIQEKSVLLKLNSMEFSVAYELRPDDRFKTVDDIKNYLEQLLEKVVSEGYTLKISEYFVRMYVVIGYETEVEYNREQFTASKL